VVKLTSFLFAMFLAATASGQGLPAVQDKPEVLQTGAIIPKVVAQRKPDQSYSLYLPSMYSSDKRWSIVYVFDPAARGMIPAQLMKDAAEEYGYIVATSYNSHNGPFQPDAEAGQAMWDDTHARLSIDDSRIYFAGFSGGARVASQLAMLCKCVSGVFLSGAGFPVSTPPPRGTSFPVFLTAGDMDFNYKELVELDQLLETLGYPHYLRRFEGQHQWAPSKIWLEAFAWADLLATKQKPKARDDAFISGQLPKFVAQVDQFEKEGEAYFAWQVLRQTIAAFDGLLDTSSLQTRAAALEKNSAVAAGKKHEKDDFEQQLHLEEVIFDITERIRRSETDRRNVEEEAVAQIDLLRSRAQHEKNPEKKRVEERARAGVFAFLIETGEPLMDSRDQQLGRIFLELAVQARPELPWPHLSLARCQMKLGNKKAALQSLKRAKEAGLSAQELFDFVDSHAEFAPFATDSAYKSLTDGAVPANPLQK
jgi:hypothetical protein